MAKKFDLNYEETISKIMERKEFSNLPVEDVKLVYGLFEKRSDLILEEKIKLARDLLRKMYTVYVSDKLLNLKERGPEWFLKKHISTAERFDFYGALYNEIFSLKKKDKKEDLIVFDFGCGINGFSYEFLLKVFKKIKYIGTEPVGQLCELQNNWFLKNNFSGRIEHLSLFDLEKNKTLVEFEKGNKIGFFFKVLDSLEMLKKDYSKEVLSKLTPLFDFVVISWATKSLVSKKNFYAKRRWLMKFISENFDVLNQFELGYEKYVVFSKKK